MAGAGAVAITATEAAGVIAVAMDTVGVAIGEAGTLPAASAVGMVSAGDTGEADDAKNPFRPCGEKSPLGKGGPASVMLGNSQNWHPTAQRLMLT